MKTIISLILLVLSTTTVCEEIRAEDWLLWHQVETKLPFSSTLTIYPPVNLYADNSTLRGSIATPYSLNGKNNRAIDGFLIIVTDAVGKTHFLKPKTESVGFVDNFGISLSSLSSGSFQNGNVLIQLYKLNSPENRQKLKERASNDIKKQQGIKNTLAEINVPKPTLGQVWPISAKTLQGQNIDEIVASSTFTIVQLYSPNCGFCKKAIASNNTLTESAQIKVIGIAGTKKLEEFENHLRTNGVRYSFIAYQGEHSESALLKATDQLGFPTYFVLDSSKRVQGIFVGNPALERWLKSQSL